VKRKKKEEEEKPKEEKTQAEMLEKYLFPGLYDQLNLSQFVNPDGTVGTKELEALKTYLASLGFSEDAINKVVEYLTIRGGDEEFGDEVAAQISLEYDAEPRGGRRSLLEDDLPHVLRYSPPPPQARSHTLAC
jgi:hypothetical protein